MSSRTLNIGVIGTGMGRRHMHDFALCPEVNIKAICGNANKQVAEELAREYSVDHVFYNYNELLDLEGLDAVSLAVPNHLHAPISVAALSRGLHVLCDKPMASGLAEAETMVSAAQKAGKRLMIYMSMRFKPDAQSMYEKVADGRFGSLYYMRVSWLRQRGMPVIHFDPNGIMGRGTWFVDKEKAGGGALFDIGVHLFDLAWWYMGCPEPVSVLAMSHQGLMDNEFMERNIACSVDDMAGAMVTFKDGRSLFFDVSWVAHQKEEMSVRGFGEKAGFQLFPPTIHYSDGREEPFVSVDSGRTVCSRFIECIRDPDKEMSASGRECLTVMRVLEAVQRSAETGLPVMM